MVQLLRALATLQHHNELLMQKLVEAAVGQLPDMSPGDVVLLLASFARLRYYDEQLGSNAADHIAANVSSYGAAILACAGWCLASLGHEADGVLQAAADAVLLPPLEQHSGRLQDEQPREQEGAGTTQQQPGHVMQLEQGSGLTTEQLPLQALIRLAWACMTASHPLAERLQQLLWHVLGKQSGAAADASLCNLELLQLVQHSILQPLPPPPPQQQQQQQDSQRHTSAAIAPPAWVLEWCCAAAKAPVAAQQPLLQDIAAVLGSLLGADGWRVDVSVHIGGDGSSLVVDVAAKRIKDTIGNDGSDSCGRLSTHTSSRRSSSGSSSGSSGSSSDRRHDNGSTGNGVPTMAVLVHGEQHVCSNDPSRLLAHGQWTVSVLQRLGCQGVTLEKREWSALKGSVAAQRAYLSAKLALTHDSHVNPLQ